MAALAKGFPGLTTLDVYNTSIGAEGAAALKAWFRLVVTGCDDDY